MNLRDKTALVTGASRRVGKAIALELAARGASIVVHYGASAAQAAETVGEIEALGVRSWAVQADLRVEQEIERMFVEIADRAGGLEVLVNSAASFERAPFLEIGCREWDDVMALNLRAPFLCIQRAAPLMRAAGGGVVVNISDLSGVKPWRNFAHHGTSKAALIHLSRAAALELAPEIRVNCVVPGAILPPPGVEESSEAWQKRGRPVPLGRTGAARDVAESVAFLASSDYVTGAVLPVDGGEHLAAPKAVL